MDDIVLIFNIIVFIVGLYVFKSIYKHLQYPNIIFPILIVSLVFLWCPIALDIFVGIPNYNNNFSISSKDNNAAIIYDIFVIYTLLLFCKNLSNPKFLYTVKDRKNIIYIIKKAKCLLYLIAFLPVFLIPSYDLSFFIYKGRLGSDAFMSGFIGNIALLSIISAPILMCYNLIAYKKGHIYILLNFLLCCTALFSIFLFGKRSILAIFLLVYVMLYYLLVGIKHKKNFVISLCFTFALFTLFIFMYGKGINGSFNDTYAYLRVDFGRDDVIKYSIHTVLLSNKQIVDYPFQTILFDLTFWIPRSIWPNKPYPYSVYLTSSLYNLGEIRYLGWGMTSSIFDELIANFKWIGLLCGPYLYVFFLKNIYKLNGLTKFLLSFFLSMLLIIHFSAISLFFVAIIISLLFTSHNLND